MSGTAQRIVVIVGPTAGGKSELAVAVAREFGGEVIGADSMQVYRGLDAGTAKPTEAQRAAVRHHLIDIVEPTERFTVAEWLERADILIAELQAAGKLPVVVGGTNLYLKALLEGMFEGPPANEAFRAEMEAIQTVALYARLESVDGDAARRIDRNDRKRIIRALEVHHVTGRPISKLQTQWDESRSGYRHHPVLIGLRWGVDAINRRINARVKQMFEPKDGSEGLIEETQRLSESGLLGPQAREAIGTKQVLEYLAGRMTAADALERVKIETRRFAKIQRTWLKRYRTVQWIEADSTAQCEISRKAIDWVHGELLGL